MDISNLIKITLKKCVRTALIQHFTLSLKLYIVVKNLKSGDGEIRNGNF